MNLRPLLLLPLSLAIMSNSSFAADLLSLDDCISLAKENNLKLAQAATAIEKERAGLTDAHSLYYPSINLSSGYRNNEGLAGGREGRYSTNLSVRYPIYLGGYVGASTRIAEAEVEMAEVDYYLTESDVAFAVKEAFFRILQKRDQIALIDNIFKRREDDLVIIKLKYAAGRESSPAVQEAEANLLQAEYDRMKAEEELLLAKVELNLLLGRPRGEDISVWYQDEPMELSAVDSLVEEGKSERAELEFERLYREAVEARLTQAKSDYWPTISLSSSYGWQGDAPLEQEGGWSAGIDVSFSVFEGFSRKAKVTEATLALREEDLRLSELEDSIEEEIEQAYSSWKLAVVNLDVSEKSLDAVGEMYRLTKLQYEQGRTSYLFLQQKESALTRAELDHANALFNLRVARASLERAVGRRS